jgi:hypothetical protein
MPKTAELTGALLEEWAARAEGLEGSELYLAGGWNPLDDWAHCGPLIDKWKLTLIRWEQEEKVFWVAEQNGASLYLDAYGTGYEGQESDTPQEAICRAVVRAAFGDEVPEVVS